MLSQQGKSITRHGLKGVAAIPLGLNSPIARIDPRAESFYSANNFRKIASPALFVFENWFDETA